MPSAILRGGSTGSISGSRRSSATWSGALPSLGRSSLPPASSRAWCADDTARDVLDWRAVDGRRRHRVSLRPCAGRFLGGSAYGSFCRFLGLLPLVGLDDCLRPYGAPRLSVEASGHACAANVCPTPAT